MKLLTEGISFDPITTPGGYNPSPGSDAIGDYTSAAEKIISNTLVVFTVVAALFFLVHFLLGGISWITAGGQKEKIETAKSKMVNGVIGLIVVALSYSIVWIVGKALGLNILEPSTVINSLTFN